MTKPSLHGALWWFSSPDSQRSRSFLPHFGIYAVISYSVNQRAAELGIRMALGASVRDLRVRILLQTLSLAGLGMLIGSSSAWILSRALGSLLFGVTSSDPATFLGMMVVLTAVACLAGYCRPCVQKTTPPQHPALASVLTQKSAHKSERHWRGFHRRSWSRRRA